MDRIYKQTFDEERSLYNIKNTIVEDCAFKGPADGESVLKETRNIEVNNCSFSLRYPLWHAHGFTLINSSMDELTRAPIWYSTDGVIEKCKIEGIKCLRESSNVKVIDSTVTSREFGWMCNNIEVKDSFIDSEYLFLYSNNVKIKNLSMKGKYTFQYMKNVVIEDSFLDTKDAFWHSENVIVKNSVVKGEYLGWFSKKLVLINCKIIGTQPLCYCEDLELIDCTMEHTDLAFEYSSVKASIIGNVDSIKNPKDGVIEVDGVGEIIKEQAVMDCRGQIIIRNQNN